MNQLNSIIMEGTLINDPETVAKDSRTGEKLVKFTLANDRYYKEDGKTKMDTIFMVVRCRGELGEKVLTALYEGREVRICGRLAMERWTSSTGEKRSTIEIECSHIEYRLTKEEKFGLL